MELFAQNFCSSNSVEYGQITEIGLREARRLLQPGSGAKDASDNKRALVEAASYTDRDVMTMYVEYLSHCWPAMYMNYCSFKAYMTSSGFCDANVSADEQLCLNHSPYLLQRAPNFYRAFCCDGFPWLSFEEFLLGWAAAENGV